MVSGHKPPDINPRTKIPRQNPLDKYPLRVKYEIPGRLYLFNFLKTFYSLFKDVFMGLPRYILNFSPLTECYNFILCTVPSCELCFNDFSSFDIRFSYKIAFVYCNLFNCVLYSTFSHANMEFLILVCERCV